MKDLNTASILPPYPSIFPPYSVHIPSIPIKTHLYSLHIPSIPIGIRLYPVSIPSQYFLPNSELLRTAQYPNRYALRSLPELVLRNGRKIFRDGLKSFPFLHGRSPVQMSAERSISPHKSINIVCWVGFSMMYMKSKSKLFLMQFFL